MFYCTKYFPKCMDLIFFTGKSLPVSPLGRQGVFVYEIGVGVSLRGYPNGSPTIILNNAGKRVKGWYNAL
jgi:hypothetical protein